jgi:hypothetical protein
MLNDAETKDSAPTQASKILKMLRKNGDKGMTARDAIGIGCYRLAARVYELRLEGHPIETKLESNRSAHFARYILTKKG